LIDLAHFGKRVNAIDSHCWMLRMHTIDDQAERESLNQIEQAPENAQLARPSIEHLIGNTSHRPEEKL